MEILGLILVWILFGVLAYGQVMGWMKKELSEKAGIRCSDIKLGIFYCSFCGPIALVIILILDGFKWYKPWWVFTPQYPTDPDYIKYYHWW